MSYTIKDGDYKIVRKCSYEITARRCVPLITTDVAIIEVTDDGPLLKELASLFNAEKIQ